MPQPTITRLRQRARYSPARLLSARRAPVRARRLLPRRDLNRHPRLRLRLSAGAPPPSPRAGLGV
eukprot:NODE_26710_length_541_cov_1.968599.p3 GENE.NODE_26710_length_541_cov_1.968599~~NODE_26710_length_541_cov_1.968599.p3  ORF type:complete len:65 (+),score=4.66 NODE_26710_length_541_cov_1.968599:235-429(+)